MPEFKYKYKIYLDGEHEKARSFNINADHENFLPNDKVVEIIAEEFFADAVWEMDPEVFPILIELFKPTKDRILNESTGKTSTMITWKTCGVYQVDWEPAVIYFATTFEEDS